MPAKTEPEEMSVPNMNALASAIIDTLKHHTPLVADGLAVLQLVIANVLQEVPLPLNARLDTLTDLARGAGEMLIMVEARRSVQPAEGSVH